MEVPTSSDFDAPNKTPLRPLTLHNTPNTAKLALDLIDDTRLTSLPLAPPPPQNDDGDDLQIVLVEDYISTARLVARKHLLAVFKRKLGRQESRNLKRNRRGLEALEFPVPTTSLVLRYCDVCDRPLYEVLLLAHVRHQQFVCGECTETYEEFAHEFAESTRTLPFSIEKSPSMNDVSRPVTKPISGTLGPSTRLVEIFLSIDQKYQGENKRRKFSDVLVGRLNELQRLPCRKQEKKWGLWSQSERSEWKV